MIFQIFKKIVLKKFKMTPYNNNFILRVSGDPTLKEQGFKNGYSPSDLQQ